jgi:hydrogenase nickel incorporation protein HypB
MCDTCGCSDPGSYRIKKPDKLQSENNPEHTGHHHDHDHPHSSGHNHSHSHHGDHDHHHGGTDENDSVRSGQRILDVGKSLLEENNLMAERNRGFFEAKGILCLNLVSSPGSGKTTLLERTIEKLRNTYPISVIEGDQQSMLDADRIAKLGIPAIQINTGSGCHLDATMVNHAVKSLDMKDNSILFIENVGNLVCPALFDLGEHHRVLIMSVTEGDDKPMKYPNMFHSSNLCLINKTDLLPFVDFNTDQARKNAGMINPSLKFIEVSAKTGEGMESWFQWLVESFNRTRS